MSIKEPFEVYVLEENTRPYIAPAPFFSSSFHSLFTRTWWAKNLKNSINFGDLFSNRAVPVPTD